MAQSSILLVEQDSAAADVVRGVLVAVGYEVAVLADVAAAATQAPNHQLVIIDVVRGAPGAPEVCREIRASPAGASLPILCISQDDDVEARIRFLEVGADDVMAKPFDARELEARVEALMLRVRRAALAPALPAWQQPSTDGPAGHRTIVCFSPKGGSGVTTIAVNVATALAVRRHDRVAIVDLDLQFGQIATHLNLVTSQTLAELTRDEQAISEPELVRVYMKRHDTGLHVLAAPISPELGGLITPDHVAQLLATLRTAFEVTVVDSGSVLDERVMAAFEIADSIVVPVYPEIAALKALHSLIEYLNDSGAVGAKAIFVVNHVFARSMLKTRDVEGAIGAKVAHELPYDPIVYLKAVNEGIPVVKGAPSSPVADRLRQLATSLAGEFGEALPAATEERRASRLGGLLRRPQ